MISRLSIIISVLLTNLLKLLFEESLEYNIGFYPLYLAFLYSVIYVGNYYSSVVVRPPSGSGPSVQIQILTILSRVTLIKLLHIFEPVLSYVK